MGFKLQITTLYIRAIYILCYDKTPFICNEILVQSDLREQIKIPSLIGAFLTHFTN